MKNIVCTTTFAPGCRVIVISDIHGHTDLLRRLLGKADYHPGTDYLILLGDLIEKGTHSLGVVREAMRLSAESPRVTVMLGNNDLWRLEQLIEPTPERDEILFGSTAHFTARWGGSLFGEMCREMGVTYRSLDDLPAAREAVCRAFSPELTFLAERPTVLVSPRHIFVHGGLPCAEEKIDDLGTLNAYTCLKYDNFLGDITARSVKFKHWIIVGHWPVGLYRDAVTSHSPLVDVDRRVVSIDGGCGLKRDGQLNALIFMPSGDDFKWVSVDDLPTVRALDPQAPSTDPISIHWGNNAVRRVEHPTAHPGYTYIEHISSRRQLWVPTDDLYESDGHLCCDGMTDFRLHVNAGDTLSVVKTMPDAILAKREGIVGWYCGRYEDTKNKAAGAEMPL